MRQCFVILAQYTSVLDRRNCNSIYRACIASSSVQWTEEITLYSNNISATERADLNDFEIPWRVIDKSGASNLCRDGFL